MGIWQEKFVPKFKKFLGTSSVKKAAAAEAVKAFDEAKEANTKEFEEKKTELEPKVLEIYEASPPAVKALIKEPKDSGIKKNASEVLKVLDKLAEIDFPGAKSVAEAAKKLGPVYLSGPITSIFGQISTLLPVEEKAAEPAPEAPAAPATEEATTTTVTDKEIVPEAPAEEKKEEAPAPAPAVAVAEPVKIAEPEKTVEPEKTAEPVAAPPAVPAPAAVEPPKP